MKLIKRTARLLALALAVAPLVSCSLFDRHPKNNEGFYERHYWTCGPVALEKAINAFYTKEGAVCTKGLAPRKLISQIIQKRGMSSKELLSFFDKEAICITWPSDIKHVADRYGFELITIDDIDSLNPEKDVAIVLIHGSFFSEQYHWVVYPLDSVRDFYGKKTVIDKIYLLKWKRK